MEIGVNSGLGIAKNTRKATESFNNIRRNTADIIMVETGDLMSDEIVIETYLTL